MFHVFYYQCSVLFYYRPVKISGIPINALAVHVFSSPLYGIPNAIIKSKSMLRIDWKREGGKALRCGLRSLKIK